MSERRVRICNKLGLHARASAKLASEASHFACEISLQRDDIRVNCKSIMGIMMLAASKGTELLLSAEGDDAEAALNALEALVNDRFGESE
ncbi:HPr family phosphocarrier protein [Mariprofundus erugo]|uniref:HPr family phosphocarrier protein n=1 Tax=Mariprofundus erugo TaxID=2528639 RepID=A0A5R9GUJ0_9PROT|nr:HPr family phosphocarrier protein [Mariprofundus erugo]TLS68539.1 HPr family phosphocarrier protein [Mariprofundus erugo]TLS76897.1 HPr family phosphocarrier protein [Mariprofundus erugo]